MSDGLIAVAQDNKVSLVNGNLMPGNLLKISVLACLAAPLFGCSPALNSSSEQAGLSVTGVATDHASPAQNAPAQNDDAAAATKPGSDSGPFVRSQPQSVAPFPIVLNRTVQAYVDGYVNQPATLNRSFRRISPYMAEMGSLLRDRGLPPDLVYLTVAESGFAANGAGPWQLSRGTARRFGLTINRWVDERRDPIKSTRAAADYLTTLHEQTGSDWRMTLVAWNNGETGCDRYLRLADAPYERLIERIPRRTRTLLNRFMAVALIARHREAYGIEPMRYAATPSYQTVTVKGGTPLKAVAARQHTAVSVLRALNPALVGDCAPPSARVYQVRVPANGATSAQVSPEL
ncbi:MAG TPA: lytic transglycosylase domain-containing protein [Candidatus Binataceae bacterium]|nr:lytic transglycosylase domain-containing protein [Candidatus Binataceae bacterium]